jgi:hypothetical protein
VSKEPSIVSLSQQKQFRIIPSVFPVINFFENLVDPAEMEILWEIESMTNERIRQEVGDIFLVSPEDRVGGPGSSIVMAAFTHIGKASRFTDGRFGVYYAAFSLTTAIRETVHHRERFLRATGEEAGEITMRAYQGDIQKPLHDIRQEEFTFLHNPDNYSLSQSFGSELKKNKSWGVLYNSVRHPGHLCVAILRPKAVSIPKPIAHLRYIWNGAEITDVLEMKSLVHQ